jgi:hypothetical protein
MYAMAHETPSTSMAFGHLASLVAAFSSDSLEKLRTLQ